MASDKDLIARIADGDERAFAVLLDRHGEFVRRRLRQVVRNDAAAADLFQEVCLRLWTRAGQWDGRGPVGGWLLRIATNLALNHLRSVRRRREQSVGPWASPDGDEAEPLEPGWLADPDAAEPDALLMAEERAELVRELLDQLPEPQREVLRLAREEEMRMQEIAETLGIPEGTVKSRLHHATRALADAWRRRWEDEQP